MQHRAVVSSIIKPNTVQHDNLLYFQSDHRQKIKEWPFGLEFDHNYWILGTKEIKWMSGKMMNEYFNFASNHSWIFREKGITTLQISQYWIFQHAVIETCFEMLESSEHEKVWRFSSYKSPNFLYYYDFL